VSGIRTSSAWMGRAPAMVRPATVLALILGLLAALLYGLIPLLDPSGAACPTRCCQKAARCCHRPGQV